MFYDGDNTILKLYFVTRRLFVRFSISSNVRMRMFVRVCARAVTYAQVHVLGWSKFFL